MQRFAAFDPAEVLLAGHDPPGFVADVDEDVVAAWMLCISREFRSIELRALDGLTVESAEGDAFACFGEFLFWDG